MIGQHVHKYCCEDISHIENYGEALRDENSTWICHHRKECENGIYKPSEQLKKEGLYNNRPASELIFLSPTQHRRLHAKDPEYIRKCREASAKYLNKVMEERCR